MWVTLNMSFSPSVPLLLIYKIKIIEFPYLTRQRIGLWITCLWNTMTMETSLWTVEWGNHEEKRIKLTNQFIFKDSHLTSLWSKLPLKDSVPVKHAMINHNNNSDAFEIGSIPPFWIRESTQDMFFTFVTSCSICLMIQVNNCCSNERIVCVHCPLTYDTSFYNFLWPLFKTAVREMFASVESLVKN